MGTANPQFDLQLIERVVREVIKRLSALDAKTQAKTKAANPPGQSTEQGEWNLNQRVISLEAITGKLDTVNVLRLPAKAVVTPAARDELRSRNVAIRFDLERKENNFTSKQLMIGVSDEQIGKDIAAQLINIGVHAELHHDERVSRLVAKLGGRVSALRRCILITNEPYTAVCAANRNPNVRAAIVRDEAELSIAKTELNPNFLVLPVGQWKLLPIAALVESLIN